MDLEIIKLSKINQKERDKYHMILHLCEIYNMAQMNLSMKQKQTHRERESSLAATFLKSGCALTAWQKTLGIDLDLSPSSPLGRAMFPQGHRDENSQSAHRLERQFLPFPTLSKPWGQVFLPLNGFPVEEHGSLIHVLYQVAKTGVKMAETIPLVSMTHQTHPSGSLT